MKTGYFSRAEPTIFLIALLELLHRPSGSKTYIGLRTPTRVLKNKQTMYPEVEEVFQWIRVGISSCRGS